VAEENGWSVGREVGYQVRFDSKFSSETRLIYMTDALMQRRFLDDPEMREFELVIIDEFHERNIYQDVILGAVKELQELGSPVRLMVMSATLDTESILRFLPDSAHVDVPGKVFPLTIRHSAQPLKLQTDWSFIDRVENSIRSAWKETDGDILVFLPGLGEIKRVGERLATEKTMHVLPLHGSLDLEDQAKVLRAPAPGQRRVILSTNVAEASVTVQGVNFVIDSGLARVSNMSWSSGFGSLGLERISLFNARQRAGRAARERAGVCLRLWTEHEELTQVQELLPESSRTDLSPTLLFLAHLGVSDFSGFAWLDQPPGRLLDLGVKHLKALGALNSENRLTEFGKRLLRFPLPPRWGALLLLTEENGLGELGAKVAAILSERDFVSGEVTTQSECDISLRVQMLEEYQDGERMGREAHRQSLRSIGATVEQLRKLVKPGRNKHSLMDLKRLLLLSHKDRLCRRRGESERGLMVGGRGVRLDPQSQVKKSEFFVALNGVDVQGQNESLVRLASGYTKQQLCEILPELIEVSESLEFVESKQAFFMARSRRVLGLAIDEPALSPADPSQVADQLTNYLVERWGEVVIKNEGLGNWLSRLGFLVKAKPEFSLSANDTENSADGIDKLIPRETAEKTLQMASFGKTKIAEVLGADLIGFLKMNLPPAVVKSVDVEAPEKFVAPTGFSHRIHYAGHGPFVEIRLQELFGLTSTPRLGFSSVPLTFHLLGPNYRPVQVTSDLAGFWKNSYFEVRKELRARYPKHSWPEDPLVAKPEAKGRRR
jgi:ATP-dependent helicase HrpB